MENDTTEAVAGQTGDELALQWDNLTIFAALLKTFYCLFMHVNVDAVHELHSDLHGNLEMQ